LENGRQKVGTNYTGIYGNLSGPSRRKTRKHRLKLNKRVGGPEEAGKGLKNITRAQNTERCVGEATNGGGQAKKSK